MPMGRFLCALVRVLACPLRSHARGAHSCTGPSSPSPPLQPPLWLRWAAQFYIDESEVEAQFDALDAAFHGGEFEMKGSIEIHATLRALMDAGTKRKATDDALFAAASASKAACVQTVAELKQVCGR